MTAQTYPQVTSDLRQAARQGLLPARGSGWLAGFGNLLAKELGKWFRTRRWLWQLLIWPIILNGFVGLLLFTLPVVFSGLPPEVGAVMQFFNIVIMTGTMGAIILAQDEIIQEKQLGTAAWIISKPVSRPAFILTKLLTNTIGVLVFIVTVPGLIVIGEVFLATHKLVPMVPFLAGAGVILLTLFFYVSLVILLGVFFESRGPVLGIALGILWGGILLRNIFPWTLYALPYGMEGIALMVEQGAPLTTMAVSELISTAVLSILFTLVALWQFHHREL